MDNFYQNMHAYYHVVLSIAVMDNGNSQYGHPLLSSKICKTFWLKVLFAICKSKVIIIGKQREKEEWSEWWMIGMYFLCFLRLNSHSVEESI